MNFGEKMQNLEEIIRVLESGGVSLEDSIDLFKKGTALKNECLEMLNKAKLEIETISPESA
jgi:exodeoxyribonuclease VII small subunit